MLSSWTSLKICRLVESKEEAYEEMFPIKSKTVAAIWDTFHLSSANVFDLV